MNKTMNAGGFGWGWEQVRLEIMFYSEGSDREVGVNKCATVLLTSVAL